jgi:hypothetical protein
MVKFKNEESFLGKKIQVTNKFSSRYQSLILDFFCVKNSWDCPFKLFQEVRYGYLLLYCTCEVQYIDTGTFGTKWIRK